MATRKIKNMTTTTRSQFNEIGKFLGNTVEVVEFESTEEVIEDTACGCLDAHGCPDEEECDDDCTNCPGCGENMDTAEDTTLQIKDLVMAIIADNNRQRDLERKAATLKSKPVDVNGKPMSLKDALALLRDGKYAD